jgi:hypothetical protein
MNDVVSLSVMLLMTIALIAGQASAGAPVGAEVRQHISESPASFLDASVLIRTGSTVTTLHIDMVLDDVINSLPATSTSEAIGEIVSSHLKLRK